MRERVLLQLRMHDRSLKIGNGRNEGEEERNTGCILAGGGGV